MSSKKVYGWGQDTEGQLSLETTASLVVSPTLLKIISEFEVERLAATAYSSFFLTSLNEVYSCGETRSNKLTHWTSKHQISRLFCNSISPNLFVLDTSEEVYYVNFSSSYSTSSSHSPLSARRNPVPQGPPPSVLSGALKLSQFLEKEEKNCVIFDIRKRAILFCTDGMQYFVATWGEDSFGGLGQAFQVKSNEPVCLDSDVLRRILSVAALPPLPFPSRPSSNSPSQPNPNNSNSNSNSSSQFKDLDRLFPRPFMGSGSHFTVCGVLVDPRGKCSHKYSVSFDLPTPDDNVTNVHSVDSSCSDWSHSNWTHSDWTHSNQTHSDQDHTQSDWAHSDRGHSDQFDKVSSGLPPELVDLVVNEEELLMFEKIGLGTFGTVRRGEWEGNEVAITICEEPFGFPPESSAKIKDRLSKEVALLSTLQHHHLERFYGARLSPFPILLVTEYLSRGSLNDFSHGNKQKISLSEEQKLSIARGMISGLAYLHQKKVMHRDFTSRKVLLDEQ